MKIEMQEHSKYEKKNCSYTTLPANAGHKVNNNTHTHPQIFNTHAVFVLLFVDLFCAGFALRFRFSLVVLIPALVVIVNRLKRMLH